MFFNDYRSVDVHFALCIDDFYEHIKFKDLIPRGSLFHPREVVDGFFMLNDCPHTGFSTTPYLYKVGEFVVKTKDKR
jgi:hypothetical protein